MVTVTTAPALDGLRARSLDAMRRAAPRGAALLSVGVALPAIDPLDFFARAGATARDSFYWERPADGLAFAGAGVAWTVESPSADEAGRRWRALLATAVVDIPGASPEGGASDRASDSMAGPLLVGGFAFDPRRPATTPWAGYPAGRLALPRLTLVTRGGASILTINAVVSPTVERDIAAAIDAADVVLASLAAVGLPNASIAHNNVMVEDVTPRRRWEALVADGARACRDDGLRKVVLARAVRARARDAFDVVAALRYAREADPNAYTFAVVRGDHAFLGATPERLVRLCDGVVDVACLAGSTARGATPADDMARGGLLLSSAKDRAEHRVVVDAVREALAPLSPDLRVPAAPRLLRLRDVQHLYTPVTGHVAGGTDVLDLVARLHPTPAVGGWPRADALAYIRAREGFDRGWYAAPVGWLDRHGEGEFAVALRSVLVRGHEATLFAGCGIVADSIPAAEYEETRLKLRPMLAALGAREGTVNV